MRGCSQITYRNAKLVFLPPANEVKLVSFNHDNQCYFISTVLRMFSNKFISPKLKILYSTRHSAYAPFLTMDYASRPTYPLNELRT